MVAIIVLLIGLVTDHTQQLSCVWLKHRIGNFECRTQVRLVVGKVNYNVYITRVLYRFQLKASYVINVTFFECQKHITGTLIKLALLPYGCESWSNSTGYLTMTYTDHRVCKATVFKWNWAVYWQSTKVRLHWSNIYVTKVFCAVFKTLSKNKCELCVSVPYCNRIDCLHHCNECLLLFYAGKKKKIWTARPNSSW